MTGQESSPSERKANARLWTVAGLTCVVALALGALALRSARSEVGRPGLTERTSLPSNGSLRKEPLPSSKATPASSPEGEALAAPPPVSPPAPTPPQCREDAECRGPKTASCIDLRCVDGRCERDLSACECQTNSDCDDGRECTRDLCFSSTQACIFIDEGCE